MGLYRLLTDLGAPLIASLLRQRLRSGREDPDRFQERLGYASLRRPPGKLVWCHAASVGEAMSVLALLTKVREAAPEATLLLTTGTVASARLLQTKLPQGVLHQFFPVDRWPYVTRFLNAWKPDLALWVESELWPNMMEALRERGTPVILINGRMSAKSYRWWRILRPMAKNLLAPFALCLVQTEEEKARYDSLGAKSVIATGNLKYAAAPLGYDPDAFELLKEQIGGRPCWVMASTHPGEEDIAAFVHERITETFPNLLTIVAPRHPARAAEILAEWAEKHPTLRAAQRSKGEHITPETNLYLADTMGEMGLFYRLCPVTGLAGSFTWGGHNPIEPAQLDSVVVVGPNMTNFQIMSDEMVGAGALLQTPDEQAFADKIRWILQNPAEAKKTAAAALTFAEQKRNVMDRILSSLAPYLQKL